MTSEVLIACVQSFGPTPRRDNSNVNTDNNKFTTTTTTTTITATITTTITKTSSSSSSSSNFTSDILPLGVRRTVASTAASTQADCGAARSSRSLRPISLLTLWISGGLTQAES